MVDGRLPLGRVRGSYLVLDLRDDLCVNFRLEVLGGRVALLMLREREGGRGGREREGNTGNDVAQVFGSVSLGTLSSSSNIVGVAFYLMDSCVDTPTLAFRTVSIIYGYSKKGHNKAASLQRTL